jgi:hypothetical protein
MGFRACVRTEQKQPQISPLRFAPVEMTSLLSNWLQSPLKMDTVCNKFVISTGAKRSGEICGFFSRVLTHALKPLTLSILFGTAETVPLPAETFSPAC